ncbi:MAG: sigma-70 family RNA polymerase sigma factor [Clostridia bacterium]|nr:sigma-70 family RNA polymerase sigma factor [Clostridia bacterium]
MDSFFTKKADGLPDDELVKLIREGEYQHLQTLINRYMPYINSVAVRFGQFESEDLIQEGRMAVFSAAEGYNGEKASFSTFVKLCINRAVGDYVKAFSVKKRIPQKLITSIDDLELSVDENPEKLVIDKESYDLLSKKLKERLSVLEYKVLREFLSGANYRQAAEKLGISQKSYDNALKRIRGKLKGL